MYNVGNVMRHDRSDRSDPKPNIVIISCGCFSSDAISAVLEAVCCSSLRLALAMVDEGPGLRLVQVRGDGSKVKSEKLLTMTPELNAKTNRNL